jgi:hypothetical protein
MLVTRTPKVQKGKKGQLRYKKKNPGGGEIFRTRPDRPWGTGYFPGVKRPGGGADHPPPPSAEVENE